MSFRGNPQASKKLVAITVPLSTRKELTEDEQISLRHLVHYLGKYDKYLVVPDNMTVAYPGFMVKPFSRRFFGSVEAHTRLMLSPRFYEAFAEYKYILMYHPDALVFSDQLLEWCATDLDYIGAPWLVCDDAPWVKRSQVGNGGFSLRKVESFLKVLYSRAYAIDPARYWQETYASKPRSVRYLNWPKRYLKRLRAFNGVRWQTFRWQAVTGRHDDHFWSWRGPHYYPEFKIADVPTGLRFAFEMVPRLCFELNNRRLPFGCHAWPVYDREFWEPYLLK
ncbi:MAG TPA: DUF5672 family protein [Candidatus Eisenbacteria bacterium]|nr:DUF5672 family protein [Candidatus Eisenbacteria bacterium]